MALLENTTLIEVTVKDDFDALVVDAFYAPDCYYGKSQEIGWYISLFFRFISPDYPEPFWHSWKICNMGRVDKKTGIGGWNFFPCNSVDIMGNPDIQPPDGMEILENPDPDRTGYNYLCKAFDTTLLKVEEDGGYGGVDMDKLVASHYSAPLLNNHGGQRGLTSGTKYAIMKKSLIDSNFPEASIKIDARCFIGINGHWELLDPPKDWGTKRGILGCTAFNSYEPESVGKMLSVVAMPAQQHVAPAGGQPAAFVERQEALKVAAVTPVAPAMAPVPVAPPVAPAPVAAPAPAPAPAQVVPAAVATPVVPIAGAVAAGVVDLDVESFLQDFIGQNLGTGLSIGHLSTHAFTLQGADKQKALDLIRKKAFVGWGEELGMWTMSADGRMMLPPQ